jgi:hypothetical protein
VSRTNALCHFENVGDEVTSPLPRRLRFALFAFKTKSRRNLNLGNRVILSSLRSLCCLLFKFSLDGVNQNRTKSGTKSNQKRTDFPSSCGRAVQSEPKTNRKRINPEPKAARFRTNGTKPCIFAPFPSFRFAFFNAQNSVTAANLKPRSPALPSLDAPKMMILPVQ